VTKGTDVSAVAPHQAPSVYLAPEKLDLRPLLIAPALAVVAFALMGSASTWATLTFAGLTMGLIIFVMASGLTLVFGLMQVLNLSHGVFVSLGAFVAASATSWFAQWLGSANALLNMAAILPTMLASMLLAALVGWGFERLVIRPVAGHHLRVILTTMGGLSIGQELVKIVWGPDPITLQVPAGLVGSVVFGDVVIDKYRLVAALFGLMSFLGVAWGLNRTKIGLLIRAGVEKREMVESLGYRVQLLFVGVFMVGCALAAAGGVLWGYYQGVVDAQIGGHTLVLAIIAIIIGGLGSTRGCLIGAILIGLVTNYVGFLAPKLSLLSDIALMVLIVLWRPHGLYPVRKH